MINIFHGSDEKTHQRFQAWRRKNVDGFHMAEGVGGVFTIHYTQDQRENPAGRGCMHQGCSDIKHRGDKGSCYTTSRKVCSINLDELIGWAAENGFTTKNCKHCDTKRFPFPSVTSISSQPLKIGGETLRLTPPINAMEHFIAYHSAPKMGYELKKSTGKLRFSSRKQAILNKAVGNTVWVIQGVRNSSKMTYFLRGKYIADQVNVDDQSDDLYIISGRLVQEFAPQVPLNDFDWFPALFESQRNFSLGFNRINDEKVIQGLTAIQSKVDRAFEETEIPDIDSIGNEGNAHLVSHLLRERNRMIVEAKKTATLKVKGRLCCEACGFDFAVSYGALGKGFCEVHHLLQLSASQATVQTRIDDLAILCSNCHRIIHRSTPMLSIGELIDLIRHNRRSSPLSTSTNSSNMFGNKRYFKNRTTDC
ncbi:MAG TPA: HNH endonuclease [Noviherbaspirillum sp.]|nr:HNH endonuclease [Noviherbaspirillum sp.]